MVYEAWKDLEGGKVVATSQFSEKIFDVVKPGGRVLDLGCGDGRISTILRDHGYETYGIDVNAEAIALAQQNPH